MLGPEEIAGIVIGLVLGVIFVTVVIVNKIKDKQ